MSPIGEPLARGHDVHESAVFFNLDAAARIWHVVRGSASPGSCAKPGLRDQAGASARAMAAERQKIAASTIGALEKVCVAPALRRTLRARRPRPDADRGGVAGAGRDSLSDRIVGRPAGPRDHAIFTGWVNMSAFRPSACRSAFPSPGCPIGAQLRRLGRRRFPAGLRARGLARHSFAAPPRL